MLARPRARGYSAAIGSPGTGLVTLHHPGHAPPLLLWADGLVVDGSSRATAADEARRIVIDADDEATFERFIASVPLPTPRQRLAGLRVGETGLVLLLVAGAGLLLLVPVCGLLTAIRLLWG